MRDVQTMAAVNLHAVLRTVSNLCELDAEAKAVIADKTVGIKFLIPSIEPLVLQFKMGSCTAISSETAAHDITLKFMSANHFLGMIDGSAMPIPLKGFSKLGFLKKEFTALADRLTYYLKPTPELLEDDTFRAINTKLTIAVAFYAIPQVAHYNVLGKENARRIPDGTINIIVQGGLSVHIRVHHGKLSTREGIHEKPRATMTFDSLETAGGILRGSKDSYGCIGDGSLSIRGFVPMIDNLNKILAQLPAFLEE